MTELDTEALTRIGAWAQQRIDAADRRRRTQPLWDAMQRTIEETMTRHVPEIMAGPEARVRDSVVNMEASLARFPDSLAEAERERENNLGRLRARTELLRAWLGAIA